MSKTIEEAAKDYAYDIGDSDWERMRLQDAFIDGINHIMQLPLYDRLTAEEKESVRTKYNTAKIGATEFDSPECADLMDILEDIFGADFFQGGRMIEK